MPTPWGPAAVPSATSCSCAWCGRRGFPTRLPPYLLRPRVRTGSPRCKTPWTSWWRRGLPLRLELHQTPSWSHLHEPRLGAWLRPPTSGFTGSHTWGGGRYDWLRYEGLSAYGLAFWTEIMRQIGPHINIARHFVICPNGGIMRRVAFQLKKLPVHVLMPPQNTAHSNYTKPVTTCHSRHL